MMKKRSRPGDIDLLPVTALENRDSTLPDSISALLSIDPEELKSELRKIDKDTAYKVAVQLQALNTLLNYSDAENGQEEDMSLQRSLTSDSQSDQGEELSLQDLTISSSDTHDELAIVSCDGDNTNHEESPYSEAIPTEVLRRLVVAGFLSSEDLGMLLLQTCRAFMLHLGHDYVWKHLCNYRFRHMAKIPQSVIEARGYEWLFRQLRSPGLILRDEVIRAPPPPRLTSDNLVMLISIRAGDKELASKVVSGHALTQFDDVVLDRPIFVAEGPPVVDPVGFFEYDLTMLGDIRQDWIITIHGLRLDTNQCCCIHESSPSFNDAWYSRYPSHPTRKKDQIGELTFFQNVYLEPFNRAKCYLGLKVCVMLRCFQRIIDPPQQKSQDGSVPAQRAILEFRELKLTARPIYDENYRVVERLDLGESSETFLHLLDKLAGWEG